MKTLRKIAISANFIGALTFGTPLIEEKIGIQNVAHAQRREIDPLQIPPQAQQTVRRIVGETQDPLERATRIFHEFRNGGRAGIRYFYHTDIVRNATQVFRLRGGDCDEIGYLFVGALLYANSLETNPENRIRGGRRRYVETNQIQPQAHFIVYVEISSRKYFFDLTQAQRQDFEYREEGLRLIEERTGLERVGANYYRQGAIVFSREQNYNRAIENYERALRIDPQDLNTIGLLGIVQFRSGRNTDAIRNLERVREQDDAFEQTLTIAYIRRDILESQRYSQVRNYREAEASLERVQVRVDQIRITPENRADLEQIRRQIIDLRGSVALVRLQPQIRREISIIESAIDRRDTQRCAEGVSALRQLITENVPAQFDSSAINIQLSILEARCIAQE